MTPQQLKGHLDMLLLAVLEHGPEHGYAVIQRLRERSLGTFDLPEGTVYPALRRLEQQELLSSSWDASSGRKRRVYKLTRGGRRALAEQRATWATFSHAVNAVAEGGA